ncbi:PREDICTED: succinate dehydrogenase assembly factor 4, mitochondrial-like [Rhagoletis zephyria]|uniref:succinate dehydrogenase assembly factor 4, mitochondrial-like n=1 Tax=Rhagoletis zephyria TaxID=28612 RepID=UPI000811423F|nr:PREDICTED: succinate dehydrogenase assembly factor 4, mitochondrial-like [Rhagoletis zephyria]
MMSNLINISKQTSRLCQSPLKQAATNILQSNCAALSTTANVCAESKEPKQKSERVVEFEKKLRAKTPLGKLDEFSKHPFQEKEPLKPWPNATNPHTGEIGGPAGPEPTRYGDWERKGRVTDF